MIVKICGITTLADGLAAAQAGAHMLGLNFYPPSPRCLTRQAARTLADGLRAALGGATPTLVGVFVNQPAADIAALLDDCGLDLAQLSGDEPAAALEALGGRAFKAIRPADPAELAAALAQLPRRAAPPACLIDAHQPGAFGGGGQTGDWALAAAAARTRPLLLAGGLNPHNVAAAVAAVRPWGVDVASGVEARPGRKDPELMQAFITAAHSALVMH